MENCAVRIADCPCPATRRTRHGCGLRPVCGGRCGMPQPQLSAAWSREAALCAHGPYAAVEWLQARLRGEDPRDVQATLRELTVRTVADALRREQPGTRRVLACGGGVHNPLLMARLQALLPGMAVESTAAAGLHPDYVEAMGFAWLARRTMAGLAGNLPAVTGARGARVLGVVYPAAS